MCILNLENKTNRKFHDLLVSMIQIITILMCKFQNVPSALGSEVKH